MIYYLFNKCNNLGRSVLLKDIKFLKLNLEKTLVKDGYSNINFYNEFNDLENYLNIWYLNEKELFDLLNKNVSDVINA